MLFKQLIDELKKVKSEKDITPELTKTINNVTVAINMTNSHKTLGLEHDKDIFDAARAAVLDTFDNHLIAITEFNKQQG